MFNILSVCPYIYPIGFPTLLKHILKDPSKFFKQLNYASIHDIGFELTAGLAGSLQKEYK